MTTVRDLYNALFAFAPASMKYDWDNVGLLCGHFDAPVDTVLVALDPMPDVIDEAKKVGAQCIVTHHPLIFDALRAINDESYTGRCILALAEAHIAAINLHTNLDVCPGGVNDVLALKEADCSIAVADGSDASRQVAQVVLLDSDFTNLPQVVMEGRKVVNNVTRTASVFFIKTIYSVLVSVICLLANIPFPFIPIQITVLDAAIEGYPSFLTIWESDTRKIRGRFLKTALSNALPFALTVTAMVAVTSIIAPFTVEQRQTVMYFLLIFISMAAVVKSCIPFNGLRTFICITMVIGTFGGLAILPSLFEISAITAGMGKYLLAGGSLSVVCLLLLLGTRGVLGRKRLSEAEAVR